jgi:Protein of unknown function (DUF4199)
MIRTILKFGAVAGLIVISPMMLRLVLPGVASHLENIFVGYLVMIVALSFVFVGVKRYRDQALGGVIKFGPALLVGLGISVVAGVFYVSGWEIMLAATHYTFADNYGRAMVEAARAKGASPAEVAKLAAQMAAFKVQYANPFYRLLEGFTEIFPVGVLISLISAALLRNRRFMAARSVAV